MRAAISFVERYGANDFNKIPQIIKRTFNSLIIPSIWPEKYIDFNDRDFTKIRKADEGSHKVFLVKDNATETEYFAKQLGSREIDANLSPALCEYRMRKEGIASIIARKLLGEGATPNVLLAREKGKSDKYILLSQRLYHYHSLGNIFKYVENSYPEFFGLSLDSEPSIFQIRHGETRLYINPENPQLSIPVRGRIALKIVLTFLGEGDGNPLNVGVTLKGPHKGLITKIDWGEAFAQLPFSGHEEIELYKAGEIDNLIEVASKRIASSVSSHNVTGVLNLKGHESDKIHARQEARLKIFEKFLAINPADLKATLAKIVDFENADDRVRQKGETIKEGMDTTLKIYQAAANILLKQEKEFINQQPWTVITSGIADAVGNYKGRLR